MKEPTRPSIAASILGTIVGIYMVSAFAIALWADRKMKGGSK